MRSPKLYVKGDKLPEIGALGGEAWHNSRPRHPLPALGGPGAARCASARAGGRGQLSSPRGPRSALAALAGVAARPHRL